MLVSPFIRKSQDTIIRSKQLNTNRRMAFGRPKSGRRLITFNKFMRQHKRKFKGMNWNWSNWIMDFLLMLQAFGIALTPGSDASEFDFNNNGQIDMQDILTFLSYNPLSQMRLEKQHIIRIIKKDETITYRIIARTMSYALGAN